MGQVKGGGQEKGGEERRGRYVIAPWKLVNHTNILETEVRASLGEAHERKAVKLI